MNKSQSSSAKANGGGTMNDVLSMLGLFALVFGFSMAVTYLVSSWKGRKVQEVNLPAETKVRLVGAGGAYRCYYLRTEREGLIFSTPLQKDRYVPLRIGDSIIVQAPTSEGLVTFSSEILERSSESHELRLGHPKIVRRTDRRSEPRLTLFDEAVVQLNGQPSHLKDLSAGGGRVVTKAVIGPGDRVTMSLPKGLGKVEGWTLDTQPAALEGHPAREVRIQFDQPLAGLHL